MSHSPGPWHVFPRGENRMLHVGPPEHSVAFIINVDDERSNAAAIAAVPDLIGFVHDCAVDNLDRVSPRVRDRARALLEAIENDVRQTVERIESIAASTAPMPVGEPALLKTFGNHLCDLLRDGECLEIERNFWCVSGLSVTAVAANGRESTIGIGPEDMVRRTDRDRFAEKVAQVLEEARSQTDA